MKAQPTILDSFPYRRKWTQAQFDEILARKDALVTAMTDAVGPMGQTLYIPPDQIHILALHLALAGGQVREELAYLVSTVRTDEHRMWDDERQWVLKQEYEPTPPDADKTAELAKAAADKIRRQLPPEVAEAVSHLLAGEYTRHTHEETPTRLDLAAGQQLEDELRREAGE